MIINNIVEVSIIVPVYNVCKYLERCLNSICNQTFKDYEVILVDDGSTDASSEICDYYATLYDNFHVVHKHNEGLGYARNTGLINAVGRFIMFIDSDDYIEPDHIHNMHLCLITNNADTCLSGYKKIYMNGIKIFPHVLKGNVYERQDIRKEVLVRMCGCLPNGTDSIEMSVCMVLMSNKLIKENELRFHSERELISEDLVFNFDYYSCANKICISHDTGYCYCDNPGTLTTKYRSDRYEAQKKLYNNIKNKAVKLNIWKECKVRLDNTLIAIARYSIKLETKFAYQNGQKNAKNNIRLICEDELLQDIFKVYDDSLVPFKSRMLNKLIKHKRIHLLLLAEIIKIIFKI